MKNQGLDMRMNIALITAGGMGSRMQMPIPKQFINVNDKPIIVYTLEQFQNHSEIDAIYVACLEGWSDVLLAYAEQFGIAKLKRIVNGGITNQDSIHNALIAAAEDYPTNSLAIIHDGNRATVTQEIITNALETAYQKGSSITAIPCVEVIAELPSLEADYANKTVPRDLLMRTQTPHVYPIEELLKAHAQAEQNGLNCAATPELMCRLGKTLHFSKGSNTNFKITDQDDIRLFKAMLDANE